MGVYTDPKLLDVRGALDVLPALPLGGADDDQAKATGTDAGALAPTLALTWCKLVQAETIPVQSGKSGAGNALRGTVAVSAGSVKTKKPLTYPVGGCLEVGATGLEAIRHAPLNSNPTTSFRQ